MMKRFGGMGTKKARKTRRKDAKRGRKGKKGPSQRGGGRVTPKGGGRAGAKGGGRVTPKGAKSTKAPLMLPGLDRLDDMDLERMAEELDGFESR